MEISRTRLEALKALGKKEADNGQTPGTGPSQGDKCFYFFPGKYHAQIEWARRQGLVESGHCLFQYTASTLTSDGSRMLKPAFCLTPTGVHAVLVEEGKTPYEVDQLEDLTQEVFGETVLQEA